MRLQPAKSSFASLWNLPSTSTFWIAWLAFLAILADSSFAPCPASLAQERKLDRFDVKQLNSTYYSEGAGAGDLNRDGQMDIVYGPHWYEGPAFEKSHEIYPPKPQNTEGYADHFFAWVYDFNADGWNDVFVVGFPATPAFVYENPGAGKLDTHWNKHEVFDSVANESPHFTNLVGDDRPELVCVRDGFFGYATIDPTKPFSKWTFHAVSAQITDKQFGHGLGVGDINGDQRLDILFPKGWIEQPAQLNDAKPWRIHAASFSDAYGGAEMYAYDIDGDKDADVIASQAAHEYGLAWFEQTDVDGERVFKRHEIVGDRREDNRYGILFTEMHSVNLADIDGDGLKDIVTGKTYYSHHKRSPMWDAGAVAYWFRLQRTADGIDWIPYQAAADCGIGRQVGVADLNRDGLLDLFMGGMKGCHVLMHSQSTVDETKWLAAQPAVYEKPTPAADAANLVYEGETLPILETTQGTAAEQKMGGFSADHWSDNSQLWWTQAKPGARLVLGLKVPTEDEYELRIAFTKARDYAIVKVLLDDRPVGEPIDLYHPQEVVSTGLQSFGLHKLTAGEHRLTLEVQGSNPAAVQAFMVGLDVVQLAKGKGALPVGLDGKPIAFDFESGNLQGWAIEGEAFAGQPVRGDLAGQRRPEMPSKHLGEYWIGGFELHRDEPTGSLTSPPFVLSQPFVSFLIGGGEHAETRMEIVEEESGKVLFKANGRNSESMRWVVADLSKYLGGKLRVRLIDRVSGGWGHLNFDDLRLHASPPGPVSPSDSPLVADEYPHRGIPAEQAAAAMRLPEGFRALVGAAEPDVLQPIAMALDDRGRVWIAEAYEYPRRAEGDQGRDRILILEDTDGNGSLDSRKVFTEGLNLISGFEVGFGGVWVGAAPYLMFIPDRNQDDVPDGKPEILLDGWGYQDTHETLNAFIWGPDGWLYGCHGVFTHSRVGKPGTPDAKRQPLNAGVWRYHPTRHEFEVFAHGTSNPWGVDFNAHGQAFVTACVIPHLYHMIQGGRYERQAGQHFNPYTFDDIKTVADHFHYLGANPHGGNGKSDSAGGGHAHAGAMFYLGDAWPAKYRNKLFMNNIHGQRLNCDYPVPQGSGYVGKHEPDFLLTGDQASQILNLRYGPDGQAWMIDWYDMQACHLNDPTKHDRSNGRIYKIQYGPLRPVKVNLQQASDQELVQYLAHPNDWYVRHARRVLQERAAAKKLATSVADDLFERCRGETTDETRALRWLWAMDSVGGWTESRCQTLLASPFPYVRAWTLQLALDTGKSWKALSAASLTAMAKQDSSPVVRLYLASAMQRLSVQQRWDGIAALASHSEDQKDHNLPLMIWYAAEPLVAEDPNRAVALAWEVGKSMPILRQFILRRIGMMEGDSRLQVLADALLKAENEALQSEVLQAMRSSLAGQRRMDPPKNWAQAYEKILASKDGKVRELADGIGITFGDERALAGVRKNLIARTASLESRQASLQSLLNAKDPKLPEVLLQLLDEETLRRDAIVGLASYDDSRIAKELLRRYPQFHPSERRAAMSTLASRKASAILLLEAIENKQIPATDLGADLVRQLQFLNDSEVETRLAKSWGIARQTPEDKAKLIEEYKQLVTKAGGAKPDPWHGRAIFAKTCQQCHVLFGTGNTVGPDLTGSNRSNLDYLLSNIVDPSGVMAKEYQPTVIVTSDGRVLNGLIRSEDNRTLVLQTADQQETIPLDEIERRELSQQSMMPEDQLKAFQPSEVRALIAYLAQEKQNPILANKDNASLLFNGKDLTGWTGNPEIWSVEDGVIIGRSTGLKQNEFLVSSLAAANFKLSLEVLLVGDEGNSGIQIRSQVLEHGMLGYQADIGPGWWGKLYEEEGRGLLSETSGETVVRKGDWNRYEIECRGGKTRTWLNGQLCTDLDDSKGAKRGVFALQVHSGGPTEVRFRQLHLEVLD